MNIRIQEIIQDMNKWKQKFYFSRLSAYIQLFIYYPVLCMFFRTFYKVRVECKANVLNSHKNFVIVSNHRSYLDIPLIGYVFRPPVAFIAKKELFRSFVLSIIMRLSSTIMVNREKPDVSTIKLAKQALSRNGWKVVVFIEGTRSKIPGVLGKPNPGAMFIARLAKTPVLPIGISYSGKEVLVRVGEPYYVDEDTDLKEESWKCLEKIKSLILT